MRFSAAIFSSMAAVHCADGARVRAGQVSLSQANSQSKSTTVEEVLGDTPMPEFMDSHPVDCSDPNTAAGAWDEGGCKAGDRAGMWSCNEFTKCEKGTGATLAWPDAYYAPPDQNQVSGDLVLFLAPEGRLWYYYKRLMNAAAQAGHYVFSPTYLSTPVSLPLVNKWCDCVCSDSQSAACPRCEPNPSGENPTTAADFQPSECNNEIHQQILFGNERVGFTNALHSPPLPADIPGKSGTFWAVQERESVVGLTISALNKTTWGQQFLNDQGELDWDKIIVSGHSQGASHAAYLSQVTGARAVLFSGPQDSWASAKDWTTKKMLTKTVKRRSLYHKFEECGDQPNLQTGTDPAIDCEERLQEKLLARMGFGAKTTWAGPDEETGAIPDLPSSLENVVTTAKIASTKLDNGTRVIYEKCAGKKRQWLDATAMDACAPIGMETLWTAMFSDMAATPELAEEDSTLQRRVEVLEAKLESVMARLDTTKASALASTDEKAHISYSPCFRCRQKTPWGSNSCGGTSDDCCASQAACAAYGKMLNDMQGSGWGSSWVGR